MKTITILDFRKNAEKIIRSVLKGRRMIMTYRGKPVMRLEPVESESVSEEDAFYRLDRHAEADGGESLSNAEIDRIVYGD